jgi:hypothetical protein
MFKHLLKHLITCLSWGETKKMKQRQQIKTLWGKLAQEKWELLSQNID